MSQERLRDVLTNLVAKGELTQTQADAVTVGYVATGLSDVNSEGAPTKPEREKRKWLGEIGGYVGGAFTIAAGVLLLSHTWSSISESGKLAILAALAAILVGVGMLIDGIWNGDAPRRLAGTLVGFGAISAAGAGGTASLHHAQPVAASLAGLAVASLGYWRVQSASTHTAVFGFFLFSIASIFDAAHLRNGAMAIGLFLAALSWTLLSHQGFFVEKLLGLSVGSVAMLVAGEFAFGNGSHLVAYILLAITAAVGFWLYLSTALWPPLAGAVGATTIGVGEMVGTSLGGALGAALGLLAAGLALLALSAWILRRRK
ncbi:MAG TPA: hypothetical protein VMV52_05830 [Candidatus Nanopelagicaceae bacterium]|nr:hypothetical protein [Candidatus Nanopelagicaceae bacterium]